MGFKFFFPEYYYMDNIPISVSTNCITCCKFIPWFAVPCFFHRQTWESNASTLELLIWFLQSYCYCRGISVSRLCWLTWKDLERVIDYQVKVVDFFTSFFLISYTVSCLANCARWWLSSSFLVFSSFGNLIMEKYTDVHCKICRGIFAILIFESSQLLWRQKMLFEIELI